MLIRRVLSKRHAWRLLPPAKSGSTPVGRTPARGMAGSEFLPLSNIPHCCLPEESGPCLSPSVGGLPLGTPRHHRHGGPLPRRPANATRANPAPPKLWREGDAPLPLHGVLVSVSRGCPPVRGMSLTRYAPFRRSPAPVIADRPAAPRLACVRPAASDHPEPGSNSSLYNIYYK